MGTKTATPGRCPTATSGKHPSGPRGHIRLGFMRELAQDRLRFQMSLSQQYGDIVRWRVAHITLYQITHPDHIKYVLHDNHRNYTKGTLLHSLLSPLLGEGLFTSEGEAWLHQRRLMQPVFHRQRIAAFGTIMTDTTLAMLERWQSRAQREQPLDIAMEMTALTLSVATQALFGTDVSLCSLRSRSISAWNLSLATRSSRIRSLRSGRGTGC